MVNTNLPALVTDCDYPPWMVGVKEEEGRQEY